jgi:hypothetical protein
MGNEIDLNLPFHAIRITDEKLWQVIDGKGYLIADQQFELKARRIAACVNACVNHQTEFLERVPDEGYALTSKRMIDRVVRVENENATLTAERDGLREALDKMCSSADRMQNQFNNEEFSDIEIVGLDDFRGVILKGYIILSPNPDSLQADFAAIAEKGQS